MKATFRVVFLTMLVICAYSNDAIAQSTTNRSQTQTNMSTSRNKQLTIDDILNIRRDYSDKGKMAISLMNHLVLTLQRIDADKSIKSISYEKKYLQKNVDLKTYNDFGNSLNCILNINDKLSNYIMIGREEELLRKSREIRNSSQKWEAFNNALRNVINTAGPQNASTIAYTTLLSLVRAGLEYKQIESKNYLEDLKAYYNIANRKLLVDDALWKEVTKNNHDLYRHHPELNHSNQLSADDAATFVGYINNPPKDVIFHLVENSYGRNFNTIVDYNYYVGMAYIDMNNYQKAKPY